MSKNMRWSIQSAIAMIVCAASMAWAGTTSVSGPLSDDASTGVSTSKTYTHAVSGGSATTLNGVSFAALSPSSTPANFNWSTEGKNKDAIGCCNNGDWNPATGGVTGPELIKLLGSFTYSGNGDASPSSQVFTLSGLTPGTTYDARLYVRTWDTEASGRPIFLHFNNGADTVISGPFGEDRPNELGLPSVHSAYYINHRYTANASEMSIRAEVDLAGGAGSGSFHLYALTNEVVPEPGSLSLMALSGLALLRLRRK